MDGFYATRVASSTGNSNSNSSNSTYGACTRAAPEPAAGSIAHPGGDSVAPKARSETQAGGAHGKVRNRVEGETDQLRDRCKEGQKQHVKLRSGGQTLAGTLSIS